jgi:uncharacterized protein YgiM (DUF1202 family)
MLDHDPAGWSRVRVNGYTVFIKSDFLALHTQIGTLTTTNGVNMRASASTDADIITVVYQGTDVEVLAHDPAGWSRVSFSGKIGYISSEFLTAGKSSDASDESDSGTESEDEPPPVSTPATLMTTTGVNLRAGPSTNYGIVGSLVAGTNVNVLRHDPNGWTRVDNGIGGSYIRSDFLAAPGSPIGSGSATTTLMTTTGVNLRSGPSTNHSVLMTIGAENNVSVLEHNPGAWSRVSVSDRIGYISSEFLATPTTSPSVPQTLFTRTEGVRLRSGPSTSHYIVRQLSAGTSVEVIGQADGWSSVRVGNDSGFIRSDLLTSSAAAVSAPVELADMSTIRQLARNGTTIHVRDIRTGITYNLRVLSVGSHLDVEPVTAADTDALFRSYGSRWSWAARPVFVTINGRTFAAAMTGMPHSVSTIHNNGVDGHFCLHFYNTTANNQRYQADLRSAVAQAWAAR